jgi:hypothetical protein
LTGRLDVEPENRSGKREKRIDGRPIEGIRRRDRTGQAANKDQNSQDFVDGGLATRTDGETEFRGKESIEQRGGSANFRPGSLLRRASAISRLRFKKDG